MNFTSVKLSHNALNFLLAQYRAIFKRAYIKGLAAAVILTAGLAASAGQVQAAPTFTGDNDHYFFNKANDTWAQNSGNAHVSNGITAGAIAGDGLSGATIEAEQGLDVASGGTITIDGEGTDKGILGYIHSGTVAGGWAESKTDSGTISALHNSVLVTGAG